jgi:seryl-tRNA synthetase
MGFFYRLWWAALYIFGQSSHRTPGAFELQREINTLQGQIESDQKRHVAETGVLIQRVESLQTSLRQAESEVEIQKYELRLLAEIIERDRMRVQAETSRSAESVAMTSGAKNASK